MRRECDKCKREGGGGGADGLAARAEGGGLVGTPTGSRVGRLDPARLSHFEAAGRLLGGDAPTKEMPLHAASYETRGARTGAVAHLHQSLIHISSPRDS